MNKTKTILKIIVLLVIVGGIWFLWQIATDRETIGLSFSELSANIFKSKNNEANEQISVRQQNETAAVLGGLVLNQSAANNQYQTAFHPKYKFYFDYPKEMKISAFEEGEGEIILVQDPESKEQSQGGSSVSRSFQIFVLPFDEQGPITVQRIKQDLPEMIIESPQQVILTKDKITGLIFFSREESLGRTREVWFIHSGYLYQVSAYAQLDSFIGKIIESWRFE